MNKIIAFIIIVTIYSTTAFSQRLADGEYFIKVSQTGKYMAIAGADTRNAGWVVQWDNEYKSYFMFIVKHQGNDIYTLQAKHSGKYLSTEGPPRIGAKLIQWDWLNQNNQRWYIFPHKNSKGWVMSSFENRNQKVILQHWNSVATPGNGAYFMLNDEAAMPEMILDFKKNEIDQAEVNPNVINPGNKATKLNANNTASVNKMLADVQDGIYKIRINESGKYLAIAGQEDNNNGMRLIQWDMQPRNNHLFDIRRLDNGNYAIKAVHSQKVLDVVDMRTDDGTQIQQWDNLNGNNQQWKFYTVNNGVSIVSVASGKKLQLSVGATNTANGTPLIITSGGTQTFSLTPARAIKFTEYVTFKNVRLTVPHGGDLDMFGIIKFFLVDKYGNSYDRYYESENSKEIYADNILFASYESSPINMDKLRLVDLGGEVKFKISNEELSGAKIMIVYGINENDADVAGIPSFSSESYGKDPYAQRPINISPFRAGGSDDFYKLKSSFNDCLKSKLDGYGTQDFFVADIPASCLVHVNLQDEDGSDNWIDVFFTVTKERKLN